MAKVAFTKLGLKKTEEIKTLEICGQDIEIKQYLPIENKLELITNVINLSTDEINNFTNPIKIKVYMILEIIEKYTNISFTEKQKENPTKLYDLMISNNIVDTILQNIPEKEYEEIANGVQESVKAFDDYKNSIMHILNNISKDYEAVDFDLSNIQQKITDPEALETLKGLAELSGLISE